MMSYIDDPLEEKLNTVGRPLPHAAAKIVDPSGNIVPRGERGEILISGYLLQDGYFRNEAETKKAMKQDENGVTWIHSGDQATIDKKGFCRITGRIKDIIIRGMFIFNHWLSKSSILISMTGGENIYPLEIEQRLAQHPGVSQASVVGLKDERYGEVVAAFLDSRPEMNKPPDEELRNWVRETLGRFKAPVHYFWIGKDGVIDAFPATSSGKIQKIHLRTLGNKLIGKS